MFPWIDCFINLLNHVHLVSLRLAQLLFFIPSKTFFPVLLVNCYFVGQVFSFLCWFYFSHLLFDIFGLICSTSFGCFYWHKADGFCDLNNILFVDSLMLKQIKDCWRADDKSNISNDWFWLKAFEQQVCERTTEISLTKNKMHCEVLKSGVF